MLTFSQIDNSVQLNLRNIVGSPLSVGTRAEAYNRVLDYLQSKANWKASERMVAFDYLNAEPDYLLTNLGITDFKQFKEIRYVKDIANNDNLEDFDEVSNNDFTTILGRNAQYSVITFEDRDGGKVMRLQTTKSNGDTIVDDTSDLTTNRTWASDTVNSDATTLISDSTRVKVGNACFKFNISTSQSVNNYATIYTSTPYTTPIDMSSILNNGYFRFWLGLHNLTAANIALIKSVRFIWGSDASATPSTKANYWYREVSTPCDSASFRPTWNRMSFDWANATQVGNPDSTKIQYLEIQLNFDGSFTNSNNIRINEIKMFDPIEMELVYFSKSMVSGSSGWQQYFTTSPTTVPTEQLLFPDTHSNYFINLALQRLFPKQDKNGVDYARIVGELKTQELLAIQQDGYPITRERNEFKVHGQSDGRDDTDNQQW